jgi:hypothetical protein
MIEWIAIGSVAAALARSDDDSALRAWPIERWCKGRGLGLPPRAEFKANKAWVWSEKQGDMIPNYRALKNISFYPHSTGIGAIFMSRRDQINNIAYELSDAEPWDPQGFEYEMKVRADSWSPMLLFPELQPWRRKPGMFTSDYPPESHRISSPCGTWSYANQVLPVGTPLEIYAPKDEVEWEHYEWMVEEDLAHWSDETVRGKVIFDADIVIPTVYEGSRLWMSHTPAEIISQRDGLRLAKGHVVIGGLGLGWFLVEVAKRPEVTQITLIERSPELASWLLPRICAFLPPGVPVNVVIGDVHEVLPQVHADVALLDIWPTYTDIDDEMHELREKIPRKQIHKIWGWGHGGPIV